MTISPQALSDALASASPDDYVRIIASWLDSYGDLDQRPQPSGKELIDVLVAASSAYAAIQHGEQEPEWTRGIRLSSYWHPGVEGLFAWSFTHTPASFKNRGIIIERDSLLSV